MWGGTHQTNINQIKVLQTKTILAINEASYNDHTNNYFIDMSTLKLMALYEMQISKLFYRISKRIISKPLHNNLAQAKSHTYNTRNIVKAYSANRKIKTATVQSHGVM